MTHPSGALLRAVTIAAALAAVIIRPARAQQSECARDTTQHAPQDSTRHTGHTPTTLPCVRVVASTAKRADAATTVVILPTVIRSVPATDAWDIVRQAAGVQVHLQGQGPGFASDAAVRGFTSDHSTDVAFSIDGVPVNEPVSGHAEGYADWNALMPEAVSSVEITKGPAVPWAGNFAMGGVVDVRTRQVAVGSQWSARFGSYGDARLSYLTGDASETGGWMLAADAQRADGWRDNSREAVGHLMMNRIWQDSGGRTFTLSASGYGGQWHSPGFIDTAQYNAGQLTTAANPTDGGNEIFGTVRGALSRPAWGGTLASSLFAHAGWWNIFLTIPPEGGIGEGVPSQTQETDQRYGLGGETRWSEQIGATHLIVGLEYRAVRAEYQRYYTTDRARDSLFYFDTVPATLDAFYGAVSPVAEAHWDPTAQLSFGIGARLDWLYYASEQITGGGRSTDSRALVTPKLSALYRFTDAFAAYASFNGGFRSSDGVIVSPALPPALEDATEVGIRYNGRTLEGSLGVFLINVRNQQTVDPVTLQPSAGGTTRQEGVELDGRAGVTRWLALFVNATVNDAHYVNLITDSGDDLAGVPVYQVAKATADIGFDVDYKGITGSLWGAYMGPWTPVNEPDTRTAPYTLLNLRAAFPLSGPWSGALGVQNILDQRYVEVQASGYVSPGTPRQFLLSVRHGF